MDQPGLTTFYGATNDVTRLDLIEELSDQTAVPLRAFCRRLGTPHLFDEVFAPLLAEGDSYLFVTVRDRPWPPWGLRGRQITGACHVHKVGHDSYSMSPVYVTDADLTNVGLQAALYKEALDFLADVPDVEINYLVAEGSLLADSVLTGVGFERSGDVFLTEQARYFTYRTGAASLRDALGLSDLGVHDLLADQLEGAALRTNALFHATVLSASRPDWAAEARAEMALMERASADSPPGGAPVHIRPEEEEEVIEEEIEVRPVEREVEERLTQAPTAELAQVGPTL
jgi:hypothetical protein